MRSTYNNFMLDGVDNNAYGTSNQGFANQVAQPSPEAIAEFKVITNNYSAEYGRPGGARSTSRCAAAPMSYTAPPTSFCATPTSMPSATFSVRAPDLQEAHATAESVRAHDGRADRQEPRLLLRRLRRLPQLAAHQFVFQHSHAQRPAGILPVAVTNPQTGAIYPANTPIPVTATSAFARKVLADLPRLPCRAIPSAPVICNCWRSKTYTDKFDAKMDGQINDRMSGFLRVSQRKLNNYNQPGISGPSGGGGNGYIRALNQQGTAGYTWTVNSSSILEGRFAVSRTDAGKTPPSIGGTSMLDLYGITGLPTTSELTGGLTPQTLSGFTGLGRQSTNPQFQNPLSFNYKVNFTKNMGRHALKTGFEYVVIRTQVLDVNPLYGLDSYAGGFSKPAGGPTDAASYGIADFLFGLRSAYQLATYAVGNYRQHEYFAYVQDDFRVNHTLTLNLGMRWEYATPRWERDNNLSNYDPVTNSMIKAKGGSIYDRALIDPDRKNFAPRIGFAWSAMPNLVVRGGYGIGYVHQNRVGSRRPAGDQRPAGDHRDRQPEQPSRPDFRTTQQGYTAGMTTPANFNPVAANVTYMPRSLKTPYVQSWFFSVQRKMPLETVLDVAYVGNHSVATPIIADYNQPCRNPRHLQPVASSARPTRRSDRSRGTTRPDFRLQLLQVKLERRFTKGLQFLNSFTWGKAMDNGTQALDGNNGNQASPQDVRNLSSERGLSNYDQKFDDILSLMYELPVGRNRKFAGGNAGGGGSRGGRLAVQPHQHGTLRTADQSARVERFRAVGVPDRRQPGGVARRRSFRPNITGPVKTSSGTHR